MGIPIAVYSLLIVRVSKSERRRKKQEIRINSNIFNIQLFKKYKLFYDHIALLISSLILVFISLIITNSFYSYFCLSSCRDFHPKLIIFKKLFICFLIILLMSSQIENFKQNQS